MKNYADQPRWITSFKNCIACVALKGEGERVGRARKKGKDSLARGLAPLFPTPSLSNPYHAG